MFGAGDWAVGSNVSTTFTVGLGVVESAVGLSVSLNVGLRLCVFPEIGIFEWAMVGLRVSNGGLSLKVGAKVSMKVTVGAKVSIIVTGFFVGADDKITGFFVGDFVVGLLVGCFVGSFVGRRVGFKN